MDFRALRTVCSSRTEKWWTKMERKILTFSSKTASSSKYRPKRIVNSFAPINFFMSSIVSFRVNYYTSTSRIRKLLNPTFSISKIYLWLTSIDSFIWFFRIRTELHASFIFFYYYNFSECSVNSTNLKGSYDTIFT